MNWGVLAEFIQQNQISLIIGLVVSQLLLLLLLLLLWRQQGKRYLRLQPFLEQADTANALQADLDKQTTAVAALESALQELAVTQKSLQQQQTRAVQRIGYYRYNAFPDTGGELSFSLALLDEHQVGFVLTSLYGRQDARVYAKQVQAGQSNERLSPEEQEAIRRAITSKKL